MRTRRLDKLLAWLATGPLGRVVAFFWDLGAALIRGATNKLLRREDERHRA
jgi:hypothetical protein